ncbi:glycosyltransferase, partial [Candidatus Omnitrophota bacterium]
RKTYRNLGEEARKNLRGNLLELKKFNPQTAEKGVLILNYTNHFPDFLVNYNLDQMARNYYIVLEPSWAGYCTTQILMFINNLREVIVQCPETKDFQFIKSLNSNLAPLKLGSSHWMDLESFRPLPDVNKEYDLIYVANWAFYKRHIELFKALKALKNKGQQLRVLLLGFTWSGTTRSKEDLIREIQKFGVQDICTIMEGLSAEEVNLYLNKSKFSILLSKKEGSCRAVAESLCAGVPVLVYKYNIGGAINFINQQTGDLSDYKELPAKILEMLAKYKQFKAREWSEQNIGYINATEKLNAFIKTTAKNRGEIWSQDIEYKVNTKGFKLKPGKRAWSEKI